MSVKDDLIAAKALIDTPEKWGHVIPWPSNMLCATQAVNEVCSRIDDCEEVYIALVKALPLRWKFRFFFAGLDGLEHWKIIRFNDNKETTHTDIMALFNRAIAAQGGERDGVATVSDLWVKSNRRSR